MEHSKPNFGQLIQITRKQLNMTQQQLAAGICSQSMLSGIEQNTYVPNIILFAQLCARLGISVERALLHNYPEINQEPNFSQTIKQLCNAHQYTEMLQLLTQTKIIDRLVTDQDLQIYYYYLGIATYQATQDRHDAKQNLQLALSYTTTVNRVQTVLDNLIVAAIAFINFQHNNHLTAINEFNACLDRLNSQTIINPNENLNTIYYLYALCLYQQNDFNATLKIVYAGISQIKDNNSHFMLADLFLLQAAALNKLGHTADAQSAGNKAAALSEIFTIELYPIPNPD